MFLIIFSSGILFQKYIGVWWVKENILGYSSVTNNREEVKLEEIDKSNLMVALAFGQSNSANYGSQLNTSVRNVYNYYQGNLYVAKDHMLGADGRGGSVWPVLGDVLIDNKLFESVIFATIGESASAISRWRPPGDLYQRLVETIKSLQRSGITITHLLWHQGETDAKLDTEKEQYIRDFVVLKNGIRSLGVKAPIYVSIASRYRGESGDLKIQNAQKELTLKFSDVFPGPNTDQLGDEYRYDGTHFSDTGLKKTAELWYLAIKENK